MKVDRQKDNSRLLSLDTIRGFDMFFIMGGDALFLTLGALFPGTVMHAWGQQMLHSEWNGFAFEDLIFPLFLFLAGVSFPFSLSKQRSIGKSNMAVSLRVVRRAILLVLLGMIYNGLLQFDFETMRYASVLGRIGLAWMFAALIYVWGGARFSALISFVILLGYWALLSLVPSPDAAGASSFSMEGCIVGYVDRMLLPGRLHLTVHDPEGILSTLPSVVTAMLGIFTGDFIKNSPRKSGLHRVAVLAISALLLITVGLLWDNVFPINKNLWTSSFVCFAGGLSIALFALFYLLVDVFEWRRWTLFFRVIGLNSITIYIAQQFFDFSKPVKAAFGGVLGFLPAEWYSVGYWTAYIVVCWLFLYVLYRQRIFLKV